MRLTKTKYLLIFVAFIALMFYSPTVSAADNRPCSYTDMFHSANVFVKIENSDGTLNRYSSDFTFTVTAARNQGDSSSLSNAALATAIKKPDGSAAGTSETIRANGGDIHNCDPPPAGDQPNVPSYPMNYYNGNYMLDCLTGDVSSTYPMPGYPNGAPSGQGIPIRRLYSAKFTFSNPVINDASGGSWIDRASVTHAPTLSGDLNVTEQKFEWVYRLPPPATPANLSPDAYLSVTPGGTLNNFDQTTDRRTGVAEFYDAVIANNFGGANTTAVTYQYTYAWAGGVCDRAGPWVQVGGPYTVTVDSNGAFAAYPRTNAPFSRKNDNTVCHLMVINSVSAGGGAGTEVMRTATISPRTPATISVSSSASAGTIDAQNGNVAFTHTLNSSNYGYMDHNVSYVIEQATGPLGTYACTSGWAQIGSGTQFVDGDASYTVYGPANAAFDRNTTQQVCQRIRITDTGGANGGGTAEASAVVAAGVITPNATLAPSGIISPGEVIVITPSVTARADGGNAFPMTFNYTISTTVPVATNPATPMSVNSPVHNVTTTATTFPQPLAPVSLTIPASAPAGAKLCVNVTVTNPTLTRYFSSGTPTTGDLCVIIANKPVFMVNGGDLLAGADVDTGTCTSGSTEGTIGGWNVGGPNFEGASTQLTAFAKFGITGFATAARGTQGVLPPSGLAFANIGKPNGDSYGAAFGRVPCMADQWIAATDATPINTLDIGQSPGSNVHTLTGNQTLGGFTVQNGVQQVIYIAGDLLITDDIKYNRSNWTELGDIPALKFVVTGNITIRNNVSVIDGVYAAAGDINTCEQTVASTYFANCSNQLEVNGSLIAKGKVNLKRTYKDLRQASNTQPYEVAEVINYRPEVWLANWPKIDGATDSETGYDGVTSLPPVL